MSKSERLGNTPTTLRPAHALINGELHDRIPRTPRVEHGDGPCNDCGAAVGEYHTPKCDQETCPNCYGQLLSCDCEVYL